MNVKRQVCLIWFVIIKLLNTVVLKMYRLKYNCYLDIQLCIVK